MSSPALDWQPGDFSALATRHADGSILLQPRASLPEYPERVTDVLEYWAARTPGQTFVARRDATGEWRRVSYAEALQIVRRLAAGLSTLGLSADRPIAILSGNSIEHLLLGLAAMTIGVPYCPVSPAYSQENSDLSKLGYVMRLLTPGLVAAFGAGPFARAIETTAPADAALLGDQFRISGRAVMSLGELEAGDLTAGGTLRARVGADSIAKFLLTSGSTGHPKAVITTHRMLCSNQMMLRQVLPFVITEPPVIVDWLPWNHTFGGSHNVGLAMFNGGSLYLDDGLPVAQRFDETLRNLREIAPTIYFNVPKGYDMLAPQLARDAALRERFYSRLRTCFFAAAGLSQGTWDALDAGAMAARGRRVPMLSGLGATETAPSVTFTSPDTERAGVIGLPAAGNLLKLTPVADKLELRVKGPNVTPGYWRNPELTAAAFDEEGYFRLGDAVRLLDPVDATRGLVFDGRISEDFKLASGTWVSAGPLRTALLAALGPLAQDVVIAGLNRDYISVLIFPDLKASAATLRPLDDAQVTALIRERLAAHAHAHPANAAHARRAILLFEPPSLDHGEITDKGSINQHAVLQRRAALVEDLYRSDPPAHVITI